MEKALVLFKYYNDANLAIENYNVLKTKFNFSILPLYIKDLRIPLPLRGSFLSTSLAVDILKEYEEEYIDNTKELLLKEKIKEELSIEIGMNREIIQNYLKKADCIMLEGSQHLDDDFLDILKISYKPILILNNSISKFESIVIVSDDGIKIHKSVANFLKVFPETKALTLLSWNHLDDEDNLYDLLKRKNIDVTIERYKSKFNTKEEFFNRINDFDLVVMGNLSRSFLIEKITKRMGIEIILRSRNVVFIG